MSEQEFTPVYLITGFLESGKTQLINSMLTDDNFSRGQKTLVICCEEGVEEYETAKNTTVVVLDEADEMNTKKMEALDKEYQPERVIIEYNSIWTIERLGSCMLPRKWEVVQIITTVDANTFDNYFTNMRQMLTEVTMDGGDHVPLGAAGIGHDRMRAQVRRHRRHDHVHLSHGRGQQHQIRACQGLRPVGGDLVDDAQRTGALERLSTATDANHMAHRRRAPQSERKRATDEANAADHKLANQGPGCSAHHQPCAWRSAAMKRALSSGSPIDTRSQCGMP